MQFVPVLTLFAVSFQPLPEPGGGNPVILDVNGDAPAQGMIARLGTVRFRLANSPDPGGPRFRIVWGDEGNTIALSRDAKFLVARSEVYKQRPDNITEQIGTRLRTMDLTTGKVIRSYVVADVPDGAMHVAPDGQTIIFSSGSQIASVDAKTGKLAKKIDIGGRGYRDGTVATLSRDGKLMAVQPSEYVQDVSVQIWDLQTGKKAATLPGRGARCRGLAFAPDGKRLLLASITPSSVSKDGISFGNGSKLLVACLDVTKREIVAELSVAVDRHVTLGPDGETIGVDSMGHDAIHIKHLPSGKERCIIPASQSQAAFLPDGKSLLTLDKQGKAILWDTASGKKIRELDGTLVTSEQRILGFSSDGKTIVAVDGGYDSAPFIVLWNAPDGKRLNRFNAHEAAITCIAYAPEGKLLASGSLDKTVRLWNVASAAHIRLITTHREAVTSLAFSPDGTKLASSTYYGVTRVSNVADGTTIVEFTGPQKGARSLTFSADGKTLFAGGASEMLVWDLETQKEIVRLDAGDKAAVMALAQAGALAMTAESGSRFNFDAQEEERLQLWDPLKKRPVTSMSLRHENSGWVRCEVAAFSPDNRIVASSQISEYQGIRPYYGGVRLQLWERASGKPIRLLGPVLTPYLAFSPDSRILAVGGEGHAGHLFYGYGSGIDFWDTLTGRKFATRVPTARCVLFSPDGLRLAIGRNDHCVHILDAPSPPPARLADTPTPKQRDAWWTALAGDAKEAYQAIGEMVDSPKSALTLLKDRVKPIPPPDPAMIARLIAQLDSQNFAERVKAQTALEKEGDAANDSLKKAFEGSIGLELKRRVEEILAKNQAISASSLRQHRAIAALEKIGDAAARSLLKLLAAGAPQARLTLEAREALQRLEDFARR